MKTILFLGAFLFALTTAHAAAIITAVVNNGQWTTAATWDKNRVPANNDSVVIPASMTVFLSTGGATLTLNNLHLNVSGTLNMAIGSILSLDNSSVITVRSGGKIVGAGLFTSIITLGGSIIDLGTTITGPSYASSTSQGFQGFSTLPVKFLSFEVTQSGATFVLNWRTAQEVDVDHFEVERSQDGITWTLLDRQSATAHTNTEQAYTYADQKPNAAKLFYRIKEVDRTGAFTYTVIKSIDATAIAVNLISIYSQGPGNVVTLFNQPMSGSFSVRIFSLSGQLMQQHMLSAPMGTVTFNTALRGNYIVVLTNGADVRVARQIIL